MAKFKNIQIEASGALVEAMSLLTGYTNEFLTARLQECLDEDEMNHGIITFVSVSLERDW